MSIEHIKILLRVLLKLIPTIEQPASVRSSKIDNANIFESEQILEELYAHCTYTYSYGKIDDKMYNIFCNIYKNTRKLIIRRTDQKIQAIEVLIKENIDLEHRVTNLTEENKNLVNNNSKLTEQNTKYSQTFNMIKSIGC